MLITCDETRAGRRPSLLAISILMGIAAPFAGADTIPVQILDPNLQVSAFIGTAQGLVQPIGIVFIGPNDAFMLEKAAGQVKRVINGVFQPTPVLDLAVNSALGTGPAEHGAASEFSSHAVRLHPLDREQTGADSTGRRRGAAAGQPRRSFHLERQHADPGPERDRCACAPGKPTTLRSPAIRAPPTPSENGNHNGGVLRFGPDGKLYLFMGDQGRRGWMQNLPNGPFLTAPLAGRHIRRAGAGQRPPSGVMLRLNDDGTTPRTIRSSRPARRIGGEVGREYPEDLLVRPPQRLWHGLRPDERRLCGKRKTPTMRSAN